MIERYFDNAATTPVDPRVLREMLPYLEGDFGNANSIHGFGRKAMAAVDLARQRVANLIRADDPAQIVFTSGATESNNWVLDSFEDAWVSPFEHSSLFEPANHLGRRILSNSDLDIQRPPQPVELLSLMTVNNEIGTIWDVRNFRSAAMRLHADATQALGKIPFSVQGLDFASFSAHKLYGPKGIGGLFMNEPIDAMVVGGEQEGGMRGGTLNVPGIVGLGAAAAIAADETALDSGKALELRGTFLEELEGLAYWTCNGGPSVSPYILSVSFLDVEGETLVVESDAVGYAISAGAACSSRSIEPSHVLQAAGIADPWRRGTIRISFGRFNTVDSTVGLSRSLAQTVEKLRTMS